MVALLLIGRKVRDQQGDKRAAVSEEDSARTETVGQWTESDKAKGAKRQRNKRNQTEVPKRQQMKMPNNVGRKERRRQAQPELE